MLRLSQDSVHGVAQAWRQPNADTICVVAVPMSRAGPKATVA